MKNTYKTYETFNDVNVPFIKTYNRFNTAGNVHADLGEEAAEAYIQQFPENDIVLLKVMSQAVQGLGMEEVRRQAVLTMEKHSGNGA